MAARNRQGRWLTAGGLKMLRGWARDGLTDEQVARKMGISRTTLYYWRKKFPEISEALAVGKEAADIEVENTLYKVINGYEYEETIITNDGHARNVKKYQHPNVTAMIFWLKNRRPEVWRDRKDVELSGEVRSIFEELAKDDE